MTPSVAYSAADLPAGIRLAAPAGTFAGTVVEGENGRLIVAEATIGHSFSADPHAECDLR